MSDNACPVGRAGSGTAAVRSIDDLEADIRRITSRIDAATYELLLVVREFDDRLGWAKWGFSCCSEWLAWQCGLSLSTAREKLRTAHALRSLPRISTSFKEGRISYSKVRSLTRVAQWHDEDELLEFAFDATAQQVEERCRQIRNARPDSIHDAKRAWERRALCVSRNPEHGTLTITLELPVETGELVLRARSCRWRGRGGDRSGVRGLELAGAAGGCARRDCEGLFGRRGGRGRLHDSARPGREDLLPACGRPRHPALRVSRGRRSAGPDPVGGGRPLRGGVVGRCR